MTMSEFAFFPLILYSLNHVPKIDLLSLHNIKGPISQCQGLGSNHAQDLP